MAYRKLRFGLLGLWWGLSVILALSTMSPALGRDSATEKSNPDDLQVQIGKTVEITNSRRYCWFPSVHQFSTGEIMATMTMTPDEGNPEGIFSAYCISKDGGLTWSPRQTVGSGANSSAYYDHRDDGSIWELEGGLDSSISGPTTKVPFILTKFRRGGMEFEQKRDVYLQTSLPVHIMKNELFDWRTPDGHLTMAPALGVFGPIIEALNGDLITTAFYTAERDQRWYRLVLIRSSDGGLSWRESSTIAAVEPGEKPWAGMGSNGPCEASLVRLADNRLFVNFRTGDGDIGQIWSSDDGKTWTKPVSIPYIGVALRVRRLSNGVLACTTGRPGPVVIMFSMDGTGEKWTHITPIFDGQSTHYTDFIEVAPGKLLVVYDSTPCGWYEIPLADRESRKNVIYATFITVNKK
jgi:hypothetical protein